MTSLKDFFAKKKARVNSKMQRNNDDKKSNKKRKKRTHQLSDNLHGGKEIYQNNVKKRRLEIKNIKKTLAEKIQNKKKMMKKKKSINRIKPIVKKNEKKLQLNDNLKKKNVKKITEHNDDKDMEDDDNYLGEVLEYQINFSNNEENIHAGITKKKPNHFRGLNMNNEEWVDNNYPLFPKKDEKINKFERDVLVDEMTTYVSSINSDETAKEVNIKKASEKYEKMIKNYSDVNVYEMQKKYNDFAKKNFKTSNETIQLDADNCDKMFFPLLSSYHYLILRQKYDPKTKTFNKFLMNDFTVEEIGVKYISSLLREPNPNNKIENYCIKSNMDINSKSTKMMKNHCTAFSSHGVTLMGFLKRTEKRKVHCKDLNSSSKTKIKIPPRRKCIYCLFSEYNEIANRAEYKQNPGFVIDQLFAVRYGMADGYIARKIISQTTIPVFEKPMKLHDRYDYTLDEKKVHIGNGVYLKGLVEDSSIHFQ